MGISNELKEESLISKIKRWFKRVIYFYIIISVVFMSYTINSYFMPKKPHVELTFEQKWNKTKIQSCAREWAKFYGVKEEIVLGVIQAESGYRIDAVSHCGAMGLMQLMPQTFQSLAGTSIKLKGENPFDPNVNIKYGVMYLSQLKKAHGSWQATLAVYNSGRHDKLYGETSQYINKVLAYADYL